jgi:hypothetical protein
MMASRVNTPRTVGDIGAHKEAAGLHKTASEHFERAAGAYRRGASKEAESHMEKGRVSGAHAKLSSQNTGSGHFFKGIEYI